MAVFTQDPSNPAFAYSPQGVLVEVAALSPQDTVVPSTPRPVTPAAGAPMGAGAPSPQATARGVLAKLDDPAIAPLRAPPLQVTGTQTTSSTQKGMSAAQLNPVLDDIQASADRQAGAVRQAGDEKATRAEQAAMGQTANAYGQYQQATQDQATARQRGDIARANALQASLEEDPEIDPGRFVKQMTTGQQILTTVLAAINGGFKGMSGQSGNDVLSILDKRVDADINAQKEQIASGRIRRGNLIAYFQQQGLREDDAEKAARGVAWTMLDRMAQSEASRISAGDIRSDAALAAQGISEQAQQRKAELKLTLGADRTTTSSTTTRERPTAPSLVDQQKTALAARDLDSLGKTGLTADESNKQATDFSAKAAKNDDLIERTREVVESLGGRIIETTDSQGNKTFRVEGELDTPHFGDEATRYDSAVSNLQRADVMGMAREPSAKLQDEFSKATEMPFRDNQKKARLQQILNMATRERRNLAAGYNPQVVSGVDSKKSPVAPPGGWK